MSLFDRRKNTEARSPLGEAAAVRPRAKALGIFERCGSKYFLPTFIFLQQVGVIEDVTHLVAQKSETPGFRAALDFHHHLFFELLEAWVREIERNGDGRAAFGAKPFIAKIADGFDRDALGGELRVELFDARLELGARDLEF